MNPEPTDPFVDAEFIPATPPVRFRFAPAVEMNGKVYDRLELREPTGEDLEAAEKCASPTRAALTLIQRVSGLPMQVVAKLPGAVLERASACFAPVIARPDPGRVLNAKEGG